MTLSSSATRTRLGRFLVGLTVTALMLVNTAALARGRGGGGRFSGGGKSAGISHGGGGYGSFGSRGTTRQGGKQSRSATRPSGQQQRDGTRDARSAGRGDS